MGRLKEGLQVPAANPSAGSFAKGDCKAFSLSFLTHAIHQLTIENSAQPKHQDQNRSRQTTQTRVAIGYKILRRAMAKSKTKR
jgi:hypothetical protein